jgi:hypothetical protein
MPLLLGEKGESSGRPGNGTGLRERSLTLLWKEKRAKSHSYALG